MAIRDLVYLLTPVVQTRIARVMRRARVAQRQHRELRHDVADFTQAVFLALFDDGARTLRSWDASRGASLKTFVGVVAEHQAISLLRSGRTNPWTEEPTECKSLDREIGMAPDVDDRISSREFLAKLLARVRAELRPTGLLLFELLFVEGRLTLEASKQTGMTVEAIYKWRSRLSKLARRLARELESENTRPLSSVHRHSLLERKEDAP